MSPGVLLVTPARRRKILIEVGHALYGARWQTQLADDLKCSDRTIRRWVAGDSEIPCGVEAELRGLLMARGVAIQTALDALNKAAETNENRTGK